MLKISEFYGITIYAHHDEVNPHLTPHFRACYGVHEAIFLHNGRHVIGKIPKTAKKLIKTWALENKEELYDFLLLAVTNIPIRQIKGPK